MKNDSTKKLRLIGVTPIMFDPFYGQEKIPVEEKFYFGNDGQTLVLPNANILGFLNSQKVHSCVRLYLKSTEWATRSNEIAGCVSILPAEIVFKDDKGKPIKFSGWNEKIAIDKRMVFPNKKVRDIACRPTMEPPWNLELEVSIFETEFITFNRILDWFDRGGFQVGIGAYRPLFGRFRVEDLS